MVIIVTIVTQGARVPQNFRGALSGSLFISNGVPQAIGVISFGETIPSALKQASLTRYSVCLPYVERPCELAPHADGRVDHNSLLIYGSLRKPTLDRFSQVTHYSTFVSMGACMVVAIAGFLCFGDKTVGNVLVRDDLTRAEASLINHTAE